MAKEIDVLGRKILIDRYDAVFLVLLIASLVWGAGYISSLKQIPGPMYGGDLYNGLGCVLHIYDGGDIFASAQAVGEHPWVPWLYHLSVVSFSKATGMEPMFGLLYFSLVIQTAAALLLYAVLTFKSKSKFIAVLSVLFLFNYFPVIKYSEFATTVTITALALGLLYLVEKQTIKRAVLVGLLLGICGLSNTQGFFVSNLLFFVVFALHAYSAGYWKDAKNALKDAAMQNFIKMFAAAFIIGFLISLLFWFKPIFVFHGSTPNDIQNITTQDITKPAVMWDMIFSLIFSMLMPYGSNPLPMLLLSTVGLVGIYASFKNFKSDALAFFAVAALFTELLCIIHPLITLPLLKTHLVNFMLIDRISFITGLLLLTNGFIFAIEKLSGNLKIVLMAVIVLCAATMPLNHTYLLENDKWLVMGKENIAAPYLELQSWIQQNTGVNDVFVATNEDGFMMNALTGRKTISYRRSHASPYSDMNKRMGDQAVIVYGTNDAERVALLSKYNVKYLLWTNRWVFMEFNFDEQGNFAGFFDPLNIPDIEANRVYWTTNGVKYQGFNMALDPAPRPDTPTYNMLVALPYALSIETPCSPQLLDHFKLVKTISYGGQDYFRVYEFTG